MELCTSGFSLFPTPNRDGIFQDNIGEQHSHYLTTAKLADFLGISTAECNQILQNKGFQTWQNGRFCLTELGKQLGATEKQGKYGKFIVWRYYDNSKSAGYTLKEQFCDNFDDIVWLDTSAQKQASFIFVLSDQWRTDGEKITAPPTLHRALLTTEQLAEKLGWDTEKCNSLLLYKGLQKWDSEIKSYVPTELSRQFCMLNTDINIHLSWLAWQYTYFGE